MLFEKRTSERLQRPIVGIQCDVRHGLSGMRQLKGCPLQQQPASHCSRSFFDDRSEQPVELRAALVRLACQILRLRLTVKRPHYKCRRGGLPNSDQPFSSCVRFLTLNES